MGRKGQQQNPSGTLTDAPIATEQIVQGVSGEHRNKSEAPSTGPGAFGLSIARVVRVDHVKHQVAIQVITGENDIWDWVPIPATCAAAGSRRFMGSIPECGDICVVGWLASEPKAPMILAWLPIAATAGIEWLPTQEFLPAEVDMNPQTLAHYEGIYGRYRHKTIPMRPGNVVLSSSQGSDLVLDEGVLITNRRANEIHLRDADQAIVFRSLQQFHAMGGARVYAGMVQRDATFLPLRMFSDGINWAAGIQQDANGDPLQPSELGSDGLAIASLTPHRAFVRSDTTRPGAASGIIFQDNIDPYSFLSRGLFIGSDGIALDPNAVRSDAEYGGKPMFRVSLDTTPEASTGPSNSLVAETNAEGDTLTEYRIELDHTWDGRLPVTEQTDGFDADRLPSDAVQVNAMSFGGPFLTWVMGSVVGNDPYTNQGRRLYGLPLAPIIFDADGTVDPHLDSGIGLPLGEHAATQLDPPIDDPATLPTTFISTNKNGQVRGFVGGAQNEDSIQLALNGGMKIQSNGPLVFDVPYIDFKFRNGDPTNNYALNLTSDSGAILISGSAPTTKGSFSARTTQSDLQENMLPSVAIDAPSGNVAISAARFTTISGANGIQLVNTDTVQIVPKKNLECYADNTSFLGNTMKKTVQGKEENLYSGPKTFLPTNLPIRETKFIGTPLTGHFGGDTDTYSMLLGNRDEVIRLGSHTTRVNVGNITWGAGVGTVTIEAGILALKSQITMTAATISATSNFGNISMSALRVSGSATISASLKSRGITTVGGSLVSLNTTGGNVGGIVSSIDRDPLTNQPLQFFGMGSGTQRLGVLTS
jgi:hypothetical protein